MPLRRPLPSVILLLTAVLALIRSGKPQEDGRIATFYGGQYRFRLQSEDRNLQVSLRFKTTADSGLLSVVRYKDNTGYLAFGTANGQLQAIVKHNNQSQTLVVGPIGSDWNNLTIQLHNSTLTIALGPSEVTYLPSLSVSLKDIYFGGAHNFFAPIFTDLNLTDFFVGCIGHVTVNSDQIRFTSGYGIELGCCPIPRPVSWCFDSVHSFMHTTVLSHHRFSTTRLEISFRIQTSRDGTVYHSHTDSHDILIDVDSDGVSLTVNDAWSLRCPQMFDRSAWHQVHLRISTSSLHCQVDGAESSTTLVDLPSLPIHLAGEVGSFEGCIEKFQFNGVDVTLNNISPNASHFSGACPPDCSFSENIQWEDIQVLTTPVNLTEGDTIAITSGRTAHTPSGNIDIFIPESVIERQAIESALSFYVIEGPENGYFARGPNRKVTSFSFHEVKDGLIVYRHNGVESKADTAILEARVSCGNTSLHTVQAVLNFSVELTNDRPKVERMQELTLAVGTRRVISSKIITVTDEEETDLENIVFVVERIESCTPWCGGEPAGQMERLDDEPGIEHSRFTQQDINSGLILFQHFAKFGTAPVSISLLVSDNSNNRIRETIQVNLYKGHIMLTANECLYVVEGRALLLQPRHLSATTDFEDQNPDLTYDVLRLPRHGRLERADRPQNESLPPLWVPISEIPKKEDSFTQADINSGLIRYVHDNSTQPVAANDSFHFRLRSTNLTGPEVDFCIRVVSYSDLDKPSISVEFGTIRVREREEISINESLLNISLSPPILISWLKEEIGIERLGVTFIIPPGQGPSYGELRVQGSQLLNDSFTLGDIRSGALTYTHLNSEEHLDSFAFFVEARKTHEVPIRPPDPTPVMTATVEVTPVNNHAPEILDQIVISPPEGGWIAVTSEMFKIVDADCPGDVLTITVCSNESNGYFAVSTPGVMRHRTTFFSMDDVIQNRIVFFHELGANLSDSLSIKVEDGVHTVEGSVQIEAILLQIIVDPMPLPNRTCVAQLDATLESLAVTLDWSIVSLREIDDPHGNDMNRCDDIIVKVVVPPTYGELRRTINGNTTTVSQFQALDLKHSRMEYFFKNRTERAQSDSFQLEFTLGFSSSDSVPFTICIDPVPVPVQKVIMDVTVARDGMNIINNSHLLYASSRTEEPENSLVYEILDPPELGCLFNHSRDDCSQQLSTFTQEDITNGHVAYSHIKLETAELQDFFTYRVCTAFSCTQASTFTISLYASRLHIINNGFSVVEGEEHIISASELYAIAPDGYYVEFLLVQGTPMRGQLNRIVSGSDTLEDIRSFEPKHVRSGSVQYVNDGDEFLQDRFEFKAVAKRIIDSPLAVILNSTDGEFIGAVNITIVPVNDNFPLKYVNLGIRVVQGSRTRIDSSVLSYYDVDSDAVDDELRYTIALPFLFPKGTLYLESNPDVRVESWTEGDLRNGRLYYQETGIEIGSSQAEFVDRVPFEVTDGENKDSESFLIYVTRIAFKFDSVLSFELDEGDSEGISQNYLQYSATNDDTLEDKDFVYTITRPPYHGRLQFQGENATNFTQSDITGNNLIYKHDDSNTKRDSFEFRISVPSRKASEIQTFEITITPVDDDPPEVHFIQDPIFVVELTRLNFNLDLINITDHDSTNVLSKINIVATITQPPRCGFIEATPFGAPYQNRTVFNLNELSHDEVHYNHTMRGHWNDSFVFNVSDGFNNAQNVSFRVNITILPAVVSLIVTGITLREGDEYVLRPENFVVDHPYLRHAPGVVIIDVPPSRGKVINKNIGDQPVARVTTEDLANGSIVYQHNGDEIETDHFVFRYKNTEPVDFARMSDPTNFSIKITLFNDELPVSSITEEPLFVWYRETITLTPSILHFVDEDNQPQELVYTVSVSSGHVAYLGAESVPIESFTQAEVDAEQVLFVHSSGDGFMNYTVSDGEHAVEGLIRIVAEPLLLRQETNSPLIVHMGERGIITATHLSFTTNDNRSAEPREITYEVTRIQYGKIMVGSVEMTRFTQQDISAGRVVYVHTDLDIWEPDAVLMFHVNSPLANNSISILFMVNIIHPSSSYSELAANEPIRIEEGSTVCLDQGVLDARNVRYSTWKENMNSYNLSDVSVVFKLDRPAPHGSVIIGDDQTLYFTQEQIAAGSVCYKHNGSLETQSDILDFRVDILADGIPLDTFHSSINISIDLINDEEPLLKSPSLRKNIVEGFPIPIESSDLQVLDADNSPDEIVYTILQLPGNGNLILHNIMLMTRDTFTQADIDDGRLMFEPVKLGDGQFVLTFTDGSNAGTNAGVNITITVEKHTLEVKKEVVTFHQNVSCTVITQDFLDTHTNGHREDTHFRVTVPPINGRITNNSCVHTLMNFSQVAVDDKQVFYVLTNLDAHNDSFEVEAVNRDLQESVTIPIRVLVLGQVNENMTLDLTQNPSIPLPADILDLSDLQRTIRIPPRIEILRPPHYGYLEKIFNGYKFPSVDYFNYNELQDGWIRYTWNFSVLTEEPATELIESFTVVVKDPTGAEIEQPGEARINAIVHPPGRPFTTAPPTATTKETTESDTTEPSFTDSPVTDEGFPMYALVPIIGSFVVLVIIVVVVIVFCVTQQKRFRRKWKRSKASNTTYPYPWSAQPNTLAPTAHANYSFNLATATSEEEDGDSEILSVSYPEGPPITRRSPTHSHARSSPFYSNSPMPRSRIGRIRSNVSISLSNRRASDMSLEDSSRHRRLSPLSRHPPAHLVVPLPVRPPLNRRNSRDGGESGYLSAQHRSTDTSACSITRNHDRMNVVTPYSETDTLPSVDETTSKSPLPPPTILTVNGTKTQNWLQQEESTSADTDTNLDMLRLFRSTNPVLKKQEYWV